MAVKSFKPYSAGRRFMTVASFDEITADKPEKSLTERLMKKGGRNQQGRLTVRHQGGGHKRCRQQDINQNVVELANEPDQRSTTGCVW